MIVIKAEKILVPVIACLFLWCLTSAVLAQPSPKIGQRLQLQNSMPSLSTRETKWLNSLPSMPFVIKQYIATILPEMSFAGAGNPDNPISVGVENDFNKDGKRDVIVRIETGGTGGDLMFVFVSQGDAFTIEYFDTNKGVIFISNGFDSQVHGGRCNDVGPAPCFQSHTWQGGRFIGGRFRRNPM